MCSDKIDTLSSSIKVNSSLVARIAGFYVAPAHLNALSLPSNFPTKTAIFYVNSLSPVFFFISIAAPSKELTVKSVPSQHRLCTGEERKYYQELIVWLRVHAHVAILICKGNSEARVANIEMKDKAKAFSWAFLPLLSSVCQTFGKRLPAAEIGLERHPWRSFFLPCETMKLAWTFNIMLDLFCTS